MSPYGKQGFIVQLVYLLLAIVWWAGTGFGFALRRRVVVLCYHNVRANQRERFGRQMRHIADRARRLTTCETVGWLGRPQMVVTFDDAFAGLLLNALPVTRDLEIPITIFAVTENLGGVPKWPMPEDHRDRDERTMTDLELQIVDKDSRCRVESHTATHANLAGISKQCVREEFVRSRLRLEKILGRDVTMLAFPFGAYGDDIIREARAAGYTDLFTLQPTLGRTSESNPLQGRFPADPDMWPAEFYLTTAGAYAWLGPWRRLLARLRKSFLVHSKPAQAPKTT